MSGLRLAALFGFYPHRLGFCGPKTLSSKKVLYDFLAGRNIPEQRVRKILEGFRGAFPYYKLIAKSNGVDNPFNLKVVEAYWLGNKLLENVSRSDLERMLAEEFSFIQPVPANSLSHHSFHVLVIGSVSGRIVVQGKLLDLCRVAWGRVKQLEIARHWKSRKLGDIRSHAEVIIRYQPFRQKRSGYFLDKPTNRSVFWDKALVPKVKIGDWLAIHWNYVIKVLNKKEVVNLKRYTQMTVNNLCPK